ncbi:MAG: YraN family protein [Deltaproteobacteria bacterium]|nr:YraN family protein [Deltaproteobacteria bacterium]
MISGKKFDEGKPKAKHLEIGRRGEDLALSFLKTKGYKPLIRNFRTRFGEIDLIVQDGQTIVFVEVKSRSSSAFGSAGEAVNHEKIRRLSRAAAAYLTEKEWPERPARFDIVEVDFSDSKPCLTHWPDALELEIG